MKRQVIQNFLNLPGLSGVALVDGRNRPFFFGPDIRLNTNQQDALAQGIQQVVDTTPAGFDTFSFRFTHQLVHIYKLDQGVILLVLMADQTPLAEYRAAIRQLKATLMEEPHNIVPTFRLLAGCVTLSGSTLPIPGAEESVSPGSTSLSGTPPPPASATAAPLPIASSAEVGYTELLTALNHLSEGATQYLGKIIVANTWKQSRPNQPWLAQFEIQKDGHLALAQTPSEPLTPEQHQWVKAWVKAFVDRGGRTIRNFPGLVRGSILLPPEAELLLDLILSEEE